MAAITASHALISGVFSITGQAMQLGFWPSAATGARGHLDAYGLDLWLGPHRLAPRFRACASICLAPLGPG